MQNHSSSVMQQRAPSAVSTDDALKALWRNLDYYPTPPWAARAMAHRLREYDPGAISVGEPACGEGHMAEPLREVFGHAGVVASDIYDFGYGRVLDFLEADTAPSEQVDWYMTNPPFGLAQQFIERGLRLARRGVIVLCRVAFLESDERCPMLYEAAPPMTALMPFVERVPMQLGSWDPTLSTASAYAAFAFHKGRRDRTVIAFKSGTKIKYSRLDDAARFAKPAPAPLFERLGAPPLLKQGRP